MSGKFKRDLDETEIRHLYYDLQMSTAQIVKRLGVPHGTLIYFMNSRNMPRRPPMNVKRIGMTKNLDAFELGYIAGLLDGEGYVGLRKGHDLRLNKIHRTPMVQITNTNFELLERVREVLGCGTIYRAKRLYGHQKYLSGNVTLTGKKAADLLKQLSPYLIVKRDRCNEALKFWSEREILYERLGFWRREDHPGIVEASILT